MHESERWKWSCSVVSAPQRPHGLQPSRLLHPWGFPGESAGVGATAFCVQHSSAALKGSHADTATTQHTPSQRQTGVICLQAKGTKGCLQRPGRGRAGVPCRRRGSRALAIPRFWLLASRTVTQISAALSQWVCDTLPALRNEYKYYYTFFLFK